MNCFEFKMFDVTTWVAHLYGDDGPRGSPSHETFSVASKNWRYPQSFDILLPWSETFSVHLEWWQHPVNLIKSTDLHPKEQFPNLYQHLKHRLGHSLRARLSKTPVVEPGKKGYTNIIELKAVFLALKGFKDQCQTQTLL